jgi:hypothetical protein
VGALVDLAAVVSGVVALEEAGEKLNQGPGIRSSE